jgi:hypothetical protein
LVSSSWCQRTGTWASFRSCTPAMTTSSASKAQPLRVEREKIVREALAQPGLAALDARAGGAAVAEHHVVARVQGAQQPRQLVQGRGQVSVHEHLQGSLRAAHALAHRGALALVVGQREGAHARVPGGGFLQQGPRGVGRSVVHADHLEAAPEPLQEGDQLGEGRLQHQLLVVDRQHDRQLGRVVGGRSAGGGLRAGGTHRTHSLPRDGRGSCALAAC